jgi:hypothetical protein
MVRNRSRSSRKQSKKRRPAGSNIYRDWERWHRAVRRVVEQTGSPTLALVELIPKLRSGEIGSLVRTIDLRSQEFQDRSLPATFWKEVRVRPSDDGGLEIHWRQWLGEKRSADAIPDWWPAGEPPHFFSCFFFLKRADLDRHWPASSEPDQVGHHKNDRRKSGPAPKYNWPLVMAAELIKRIHEAHGELPENDSELAQSLLEVCAKLWDGWEPSESEMRKLISQLLGRARNSS